MANKYLEKIAKDLSDAEIDRHAKTQYMKGLAGRLVGAVTPVPLGGSVGEMVGRSHHLAKVKSLVTGRDTSMGEVSREAVRSWARGGVRGIGEGIVGGGLGAAVGAGLGGAVGRSRDAARMGGIVGGGVGLIAGAFHGDYKSNKNSLHDFVKEWKSEKNQD